jgi:magnesium-transporting ATPase (P-type)
VYLQDAFGVFMVFFVLYSFVVPISVFVSVELVRVAQASFMMWDNGMRSSTGRAMKAHNSNLNEDLGAVSQFNLYSIYIYTHI